MKRTLQAALSLLLCVSSHLGRAQSSSSSQREPEEGSLGQLLLQRQNTDAASSYEASPLASQATLLQQGSQNQSSIEQHLVGVGRGNAALITQNGAGNAAAILQNGAGTRVSIAQSGANNVAASELNGYNTESDIVQKGNNNRVDQRLNVDEHRYSVEQMGNNNNLIQRESGSTTPGYEVTMKGNGIRIIIEQGRVATQP